MANSNRRQRGPEKKYWSVGLSRIPSSLFELIWWVCSCMFSFSHTFSDILSLYVWSLISFSFVHSFPSSSFFFSISKGFSPRGKEGVIWSLPALIKTSVWLTGISCADVWVCVYFSVVLWPHDNLFPFVSFSILFFLFVFTLSFCFSQGIDEASSKEKWVGFFWVGSSFKCLICQLSL